MCRFSFTDGSFLKAATHFLIANSSTGVSSIDVSMIRILNFLKAPKSCKKNCRQDSVTFPRKKIESYIYFVAFYVEGEQIGYGRHDDCNPY